MTDTGSVLAGYTLTSGPQSNPDPTTSIHLTAGDVDVSRDFGYRNPSLFFVADAVWDDADGDGVRDPGEAGISGVTVALRDGGGNLIGTALTDGTGALQFSGLGNGNYTVVLTDTSGLLVNLQATTAPASTGSLAVTVAGADVTSSSFGYRTLGSIGEIVWSDANGDGVRDPSEPGIAGVTLRLVLSGLDGLFGTVDDQVYATTTTAADGTYRFNGLPKTYYRVEVTDTGGVLTGSAQTGDPDAVLDGKGDVPLLAGAVDLTMNFGYQDAALADLSGSVFDDVDLDGVADPGETGIAGVSLDLVASGPDGIYGTIDDLVLATTTSGANGDYTFVDVPDGSYQVVVTDTGNVLNGYTLTSGLDAIAVTVAGVDVSDVDFGYAHDFGTASIGTRVWLDANRDGVSNPSEDGIRERHREPLLARSRRHPRKRRRCPRRNDDDGQQRLLHLHQPPGGRLLRGRRSDDASPRSRTHGGDDRSHGKDPARRRPGVRRRELRIRLGYRQRHRRLGLLRRQRRRFPEPGRVRYRRRRA